MVSLCAPARDRRFGAAQVRHQHGDGQVRNRERVCDDLGRVGELRQHLRRHETADFDLAQSAGRERRDPRLLCRERHDGLDALQAVARPHFADEDVAVHVRSVRRRVLELLVGRVDVEDVPVPGGRRRVVLHRHVEQIGLAGRQRAAQRRREVGGRLQPLAFAAVGAGDLRVVGLLRVPADLRRRERACRESGRTRPSAVRRWCRTRCCS